MKAYTALALWVVTWFLPLSAHGGLTGAALDNEIRRRYRLLEDQTWLIAPELARDLEDVRFHDFHAAFAMFRVTLRGETVMLRIPHPVGIQALVDQWTLERSLRHACEMLIVLQGGTLPDPTDPLTPEQEAQLVRKRNEGWAINRALRQEWREWRAPGSPE